MKPGDRVVICRRSHPWYGRAGVITRAYGSECGDIPRLGLDWVIQLDSGRECCAESADVRSPDLEPETGALF
jgi:hypothetical protein